MIHPCVSMLFHVMGEPARNVQGAVGRGSFSYSFVGIKNGSGTAAKLFGQAVSSACVPLYYVGKS